MKPRAAILFFILAIAWSKCYAGKPVNVKQFINHTDWNFVENKGQITGSEIKYYGHQGGVYLYCKPGKISFVFTKVENEPAAVSEATGMPVGVQNFEALRHKQSPLVRRSFSGVGTSRTLPAIALATARADLTLLNSNPSATILASDQQEYYENYYTTGNANCGITNVHTFKTITYKNIYPHIDMVLHAKPNGMKYEFVIYPGGKVSDIQMQWGGIEKIKKFPSARAGKDSKIEYSCALGRMEESQPISFQGENIIGSSFAIDNETVGFKVNKYDRSKTLVIDPTLIWGTYFGDSETEATSDVALDKTNNIYISGITAGSSGLATSGAYQTTVINPLGTFNTYLAKFNSNGEIKWATYYGEEGSVQVSENT